MPARSVSVCTPRQFDINGVYQTEIYKTVTPFAGTTPLESRALCHASRRSINIPGLACFHVRPVLLWQFLSQLAIDITLRIGAPQLEMLNTTSLMLPPRRRAATGAAWRRGQAQPDRAGGGADQRRGADPRRIDVRRSGARQRDACGRRQHHHQRAARSASPRMPRSTARARSLRHSPPRSIAKAPPDRCRWRAGDRAVAHPTFARIRGARLVSRRSRSRVRTAERDNCRHGRVRATGFPAKSGEADDRRRWAAAGA